MHGKSRMGLWLGLVVFAATGSLITYFSRDKRSSEEKKYAGTEETRKSVRIEPAAIVDTATSFTKEIALPQGPKETTLLTTSDRKITRPTEDNESLTGDESVGKSTAFLPAKGDNAPASAPDETTSAVAAALMAVDAKDTEEKREEQAGEPSLGGGEGLPFVPGDGSRMGGDAVVPPTQQKRENISRFRRGEVNDKKAGGAGPKARQQYRPSGSGFNAAPLPLEPTAQSRSAPDQGGRQDAAKAISPALGALPGYSSFGGSLAPAGRSGKGAALPGKFLPMGTSIHVYFLSTFESGNMRGLVEFGVAENVIFNRRVMLPFGTRIYGKPAGAPFRDRMDINVTTIVYPDGREVPISGLMTDVDGVPGVRGYFMPSPLWAEFLPFAEKFLTAWQQAISEQRNQRAQNALQAAAGMVSSRFAAGASAIQAANDGASAIAAKYEARLAARYQDYLLIPAGTPAKIQLQAQLRLDQGETPNPVTLTAETRGVEVPLGGQVPPPDTIAQLEAELAEEVSALPK